MSIHPDHLKACQVLSAMMFTRMPSEDEIVMLEKFIELWEKQIPVRRRLNRNL